MAYNSSETVKGKFIGNVLFPYSSIQEALDATYERDRFSERYILIDGVTKIYWFRDGIGDINLVPKFPGDKPFTQVTSSGNETVLNLDVAELFYFDGTNAPLQEDTEIQITGDSSVRLIQLEINQDDVGGWEVTFDAGITLLPNYIIDTAPNSKTVLNFYKNSNDTWSAVSSIYDLTLISTRFGVEDNLGTEDRYFDGNGYAIDILTSSNVRIGSTESDITFYSEVNGVEIYGGGTASLSFYHNTNGQGLYVNQSGKITLSSRNGENILLETDGAGTLQIDIPSKGVDKFLRSDGDGIATWEDILGGVIYEEKTKAEIDSLISSEDLIPGVLYKITGVDIGLYNDGTSSGTSIFLKALSTTELEKQGHGIFYNPKYDKLTSGYGIWDSGETYSISDKVIWGGYSWTNVNGNVGSQDGIFGLDGEWTKDTFDNTNYNIVFDIIKYDYSNDAIIYREDISGNIVHCENSAFSFSYRSIAVFQWGNDYTSGDLLGVAGNVIIESYFENINSKASITRGNKLERLSYIENLICEETSEFSWNKLDDHSYMDGCEILSGGKFEGNVISTNSHIETLNVSGVFSFNKYENYSYSQDDEINSGCNFYHNTFINHSYSYTNILNGTSYISNNIFENNSYLDTNTLNGSTYFDSNKCQNNGAIQTSELNDNSYISNNLIQNSAHIDGTIATETSGIFENIIMNTASVGGNTLSSGGTIQDNTLGGNITISNNILSNTGRIISCNMVNSVIDGNTLDNSAIDSIKSANSYIEDNDLTDSGIAFNDMQASAIRNVTGTNTTNISYNTLFNSAIDLTASGSLNSKQIQLCRISGVNLGTDLSSATIIFTNLIEKFIYVTPSNTQRLRYYDNADAMIITSVDA